MDSPFMTHLVDNLAALMEIAYTALLALRWDVLMAKEFTMGQAVK